VLICLRANQFRNARFGCRVLFSDFPKYFCFRLTQITSYPILSRPNEGRLAIVTNAGRDAMDAAAFCVRWDGRAGFGL
jgi:hypothetical protein